MKVERVYLGDALRHLRGRHGRGNPQPVVYRTTGETVGPGVYHCTLCGEPLRLSRYSSLPLCANCDGSEFIAGPEDGPASLEQLPRPDSCDA